MRTVTGEKWTIVEILTVQYLYTVRMNNENEITILIGAVM